MMTNDPCAATPDAHHMTTGLTPFEVHAAVQSAPSSLPIERRATFTNRTLAMLEQYSAPSDNTVCQVIASVRRDLCLSGGE